MSLAHVWTGVRLDPAAVAVLDGVATLSVSSEGERGEWYTAASNADAILLGGALLSAEVMDRLGPRLRIIARTGIGVDRIDLTAATQRGIMVVNTPDGPTESTAEHAIALLLNLCKRVSVGDRFLRAGSPGSVFSTLTPGLEVAGSVLGIVGLGRIGSRVALIAKILAMKVLAYDPHAAPERANSLGVEAVSSLDELLTRSQIVSLHCPATPENSHMINARTLQLMPEGSYLINVSRGALVDENALLAALRSGHLAGAGLDVFEREPPDSSNPLLSLPNTVCTPHIASYTEASLRRMQVMACEQIVRALRGERPGNLVNTEVWGYQRRGE